MKKKALAVGIGSLIREDDGIGPYCIKLLQQKKSWAKKELVDYLVVHQLDVIHCTVFAEYELIVFIDADAQDGTDIIRVEEILPEPKPHYFTSHIGSISDIISLTGGLFGVTPKAYLVAVKGSSFAVGDVLTSAAQENSQKAVEVVQQLIDKIFPFA